MQPARTLIAKAFHLLDVLAAVLSPLAIVAFLVLMIVLLDNFATHMRLLREIDQFGVDVTATWRGVSSDGSMGVVELPPVEGDYQGAVIYTKHYRAASLAGLQVGQAVQVRYTLPPEADFHAVLLDHIGEVRAYSGYLRELFWPLLFTWGILLLRPDFLYLGLADIAPDALASQPPGDAR
jgi:hypothetical protein